MYQLTRVTESSATIIDNIFSNNIQDDIISGNLLLTFSEHFSQFITVTRGKIEFKKLNVYLRDYSKFSNESFREDVSIQNCESPLLFLLYINDLPNINKVLNFYLFADDTNIYYESNSLSELERTVNKELRKLYLWLNVNRLSLNLDSISPLNKMLPSRLIKKPLLKKNA